ncbi:hypothetical protein SPAN111604_01060 [Sphingomonas antarctica]|uniref:PEPxxWA-CTERM sorting domain-containing protein n=1 Tax=Sphingomonas antarctica TaxID=2040274 RepID=UPI0039EC6E91
MGAFVVAAAAFALAPVTANAITYDAVSSFSSGNPSGSWAYGTGAGSTGFVPFSTYSSTCFGQSGFACHSFGDYQGVGLNTTAGDVNPPGLSTVAIPNDELWLHPADGAGATDTVVTFLVSTTSTYSVSGLFQRLSNAASNGSGNGVLVSIYNGASLLYSSSALAGTPAAATQATFNFTQALAAGSTVSFVVNNNGNYQYDSTGLSASIAAVPEPAQWALMIGGFGVVGVTMRRRRSAAAAA